MKILAGLLLVTMILAAGSRGGGPSSRPSGTTSPPRAILDPRTAVAAPQYQDDPLALNPRPQFEDWVRTLDNGTLQFGISIHEADGLLPALDGATVADIGAGYGNNLPAWKSLLGPRGHLVETEVDINAARFMAYAAHQLDYAAQTVVVLNSFESADLPTGQFDLVLCSQLHSHITISHVVNGPSPANDETARIFREQSSVFLGSIRRALKNEQSLLIVIEGFQNRGTRDPHQVYLDEAEAIANIEANGFRLVARRENDHVWVASFASSDTAR